LLPLLLPLPPLLLLLLLLLLLVVLPCFFFQAAIHSRASATLAGTCCTDNSKT
jgi:hypothetical protein